MPNTVQMHSTENIANSFKSGFFSAGKTKIGKSLQKGWLERTRLLADI
jgi:hypothetical protein